MHLTGCPSIFSRVTGQRKIIKLYLCTSCRYISIYIYIYIYILIQHNFESSSGRKVTLFYECVIKSPLRKKGFHFSFPGTL
jgi:hypothetical protein